MMAGRIKITRVEEWQDGKLLRSYDLQEPMTEEEIQEDEMENLLLQPTNTLLHADAMIRKMWEVDRVRRGSTATR